MSVSELACTYAILILYDDNIPITAGKIATLVKSVNVSMESYWLGLFAKLVEMRNINDLIMNIGSGGGSTAALAAVAAPAGGAAASVAPSPEENKKELREESDEDMGIGLKTY